MNVIVGMECLGRIREAFRARGHEAYSCDLKPASDGSRYHIQGDLFEVMDRYRDGFWDMGIFHPVCQFLSVSGFHWCYKDPAKYPKTLCGPARLAKVDAAVADFMRVWNLPIKRLCIENPIGIMSTRLRQPDQLFQPHEFGDDASKRTCLWLRGLPPILRFGHAQMFGRMVSDPNTGKLVERWENQTDSGQNKLGPSPERAAERAETYPGFASACAEQWG
jgi:hypothetical protein